MDDKIINFKQLFLTKYVTQSASTFWNGMIQRSSLRGRGTSLPSKARTKLWVLDHGPNQVYLQKHTCIRKCENVLKVLSLWKKHAVLNVCPNRRPHQTQTLIAIPGPIVTSSRHNGKHKICALNQEIQVLEGWFSCNIIKFCSSFWMDHKSKSCVVKSTERVLDIELNEEDFFIVFFISAQPALVLGRADLQDLFHVYLNKGEFQFLLLHIIKTNTFCFFIDNGRVTGTTK